MQTTSRCALRGPCASQQQTDSGVQSVSHSVPDHFADPVVASAHRNPKRVRSTLVFSCPSPNKQLQLLSSEAHR